MSAYTTLKISQEKTKSYLTEFILSCKDDKILESLLNELISVKLYNVKIVHYLDKNDDSLIT